MPPKKTLTKRQMDTLDRHKKHHTLKHIAIMKKEMLKGKTFKQSHNIALKKHGN